MQVAIQYMLNTMCIVRIWTWTLSFGSMIWRIVDSLLFPVDMQMHANKDASKFSHYYDYVAMAKAGNGHSPGHLPLPKTKCMTFAPP